jgi:uncharacterized protein YjbJ (UPF0337 family)
MADQHVNGATSTVKGSIKEAAGKVTGDRKLEVEGKAQKVQGKVQNGLGNAQDAVRKDDRR